MLPGRRQKTIVRFTSWAVLAAALVIAAYLAGARLARLWATPPPQEPPHTPAATPQVASLVPGEIADGTLGSEGVDIWQFDAQAGQSIILEVWIHPLDSSNPEAKLGLDLTGTGDMTLFHQAGSASFPPYVNLKLPVSGTYHVRLIPLSGSIGRYSLRLTLADEAEPTPNSDADAPTATPQPEMRTYTVEEGDNLSSIAVEFNVTVPVIVKSNEQITSSDSIIYPGMVLSIPASLPTPTPIPEEYYLVEQGDTLYDIAQESEYTVQDWIRANAETLEAPFWVYEGDVLRIPGRSTQGEGPDCSRATGWKERREVTTHIVQQEGMNLGCLAYMYGISMSTIRWANREQLGDPDHIQVGQTLTILPVNGMLHTVTEGETLEEIAERYQIEVADIVDWTPNNLTPESKLTVGQEIVLPNAQSPQSNVASATEPQATPQPTAPDEPASPGGVKYVDPFYSLSQYDTGYCANPPSGWGWSGGLSWPTDSRDVHPRRGFSEWHPAIDILAPLGSSVYAAERGTVIWAGWNTWGGGNLVILDHGSGRWTLYAHLDSVSVGCGQAVGRGEAIGTIGQTGASSFPHLHFELRRNGYNYNPLNLLP